MRKLIKRHLLGGPVSAGTINVGATLLNENSEAFTAKIPRVASKLNGISSLPFGKQLNIFGHRLDKLDNNGLLSMGANIAESLLPKRITSKGVDVANNILSMAENIPVYGKLATFARLGLNTIDSLGASKLAEVQNDLSVIDTLAHTGGGYENFMSLWNAAKDLSGLKAGLFTGKTALNNLIYDANYKMSILKNIIGRKTTDDLLTALMEDRWNERTMMDMNGGLGNISFGRLGLKIEILNKVHSILNRPKVVDSLTEFLEEIPEFKDGGKMNVIPEGSLHARLHHMENAEGLTKKGIPVVSIAEGGELEQQAEIELNEIIFNLEVTLTLEKLMEDGSDSAAIEAGKLLVKEIFENTDDRTGLIKDLEPEKKKSTTEDIVKNHQVFQNGGILEKINNLSSEQLEKLTKFLNEV